MRCALLAGLMLGGSALHAGTVPWPVAAYSHFADNQKLETVLSDFAGSFSLALNLAPGVTGSVSGKFTTASPTEFISKLAGVYGFVWYSHAGTLYVSKANDVVTRTLLLPGGNLSNLQVALTSLGVLDPRFGWGELPGQGLVMVSGPASYVKLVEDTVRQLPAGGGAALQAAVFKLRNATADDRTVRYRDREIMIPGLASILRNLINGQGQSGFTTSTRPTAQTTPLKASAPLSADTLPDPSAPGGTSGTSVTPGKASLVAGAARSGDAKARSEETFADRQRAPTVQADPRLNALIIQDMPDRMPIYQRLIEQLDVPAALIEIEAMIIDVNTDRAKELGINWGGRAGTNALGFGTLAATPAAGTLSVVSSAVDSTVNPSSLIVNGGNYLVSQIRLLESRGEARVQSRPSVITLENVGAVLDLSETFYIQTQGVQVATVTPVTAGTTLNVTPRSLPNGSEQMVQLTIDIEDGQIQATLLNGLPRVTRSSVSTQAIVRSNDTLLIAGHTQDQSVDNSQKVPLLGDIPGFGALFSNKSSSVQRRERLFMIKPRIISFPLAATIGTAPVAPAPTDVAPAVR
ncbi:MAG: type III secretion system outer membrane ring subunit SctC [Polaromonas sp.]|nr:type III secretion system outer membrane ring subunit SctC [Polaromonas sp.]